MTIKYHGIETLQWLVFFEEKSPGLIVSGWYNISLMNAMTSRWGVVFQTVVWPWFHSLRMKDLFQM